MRAANTTGQPFGKVQPRRQYAQSRKTSTGALASGTAEHKHAVADEGSAKSVRWVCFRT